MKIFYTDHYVLPLPAGHRFPIAKYSLLRKRVEEAGLATGRRLREPQAASDIDIELPDGTADADYLDALEQGICHALCAAQPDLAIYLAGADPYVGDRLGRLALTKEGLHARDRKVFELCRAASVPVAVAMAGAYSNDIADTVDIHFTTVETAANFWRAAQRPTSFPAARQI